VLEPCGLAWTVLAQLHSSTRHYSGVAVHDQEIFFREAYMREKKRELVWHFSDASNKECVVVASKFLGSPLTRPRRDSGRESRI
jgi:hypothetical protein